MRLKCLTLCFLVALSACSLQVDVIETPTPGVTVPPTEATPSTPAVTLESSATPPPLPTYGPTNTFVPASAMGQSVAVSPLQFGPNGTYVDIIESIKGGAGKTYSVRAMKGQVMSVSFHQADASAWTYITMRIIGADDSVLCDTCEFWRGVLPATQDYFFTVTPSADALDFVIRVAINPPGAATQSFLYENKYRNASLSYTDVFAPALFPGAIVHRIEPEMALQFIDTQSYTNTNLIEAYMLFGSSTDPQLVAACTEPVNSGEPETVTGGVTVNGISFTRSERIGAAAGNVYEQTYYRAVQNGTCFEITYFIHYGNIGNYDPASVTEFERNALLQRFDEVFSTFRLN